jgi:hypothetical protein
VTAPLICPLLFDTEQVEQKSESTEPKAKSEVSTPSVDETESVEVKKWCEKMVTVPIYLISETTF